MTLHKNVRKKEGAPAPAPLVFRAVRSLARSGAVARRLLREARSDAYYRIRETPSGRALLSAAEFALAPRERSVRRRAGLAYNAQVASAAMDPAKGYCLLPPGYFEDGEPVFAACQQLFERKRAKAEERPPDFASWSPARQQKYLATEKSSFLHNLLNNQDLREHPELVDFALSDKVLGIVTKYLGAVPYLSRIDLVYSQPREADGNIASQLFHVDPEGLTQVKFFIYLFDVDDPQGPFTFIPADDSDRILQAVRAYRRRTGKPQVGRYPDEEVAAAGASHETVEVKGPRGSGVAVDTSRCLHLGSRVKPGAFRLCLYLQYCTTPQRGANMFDAERFRSDAVKYLAVAPTGIAAGSPFDMAG